MLGERLTMLLSLIAQDEYKTLNELSQKMDLSTKTVRGLLRELDERLLEHGAQIVHQRGKGYLLEVHDMDRFQAFFLMPGQKAPSDSQERTCFLIEYFLKNDCYTKVESLCEQLYVSRKTLTSDLRQAEDFFRKFQLNLERKPHYGMRLIGDEFQKRHCLSEYLQERNHGPIDTILPGDAQEYQIAHALIELLEREDYHITDVGLNSLVLHVVIAIQRIHSGQYIEMPEDEYEKWSAGSNYELAQKCSQKISELTGVVFPEQEIRYLAIHLAGKQTDQNFVIDSNIQETVAEMLEEIYQVFQMDFRDDLELIFTLSTHLVPLVIRMKYGMRLKNPLLNEIRQRYSLAYTIAVQASAVLERRYNCIIDSNEVAYLALTLQLSLERRRSHTEKKNVLLVCASGAGSARLMAYKMKEQFGDTIDRIVTCDQRSIGRQDFSKIDYIFTTVPIQEHVPVPICEVRQLFESSGSKAIRGFLKGGPQNVLRYYPKELFFPELDASTKEEALQELVRHIGCLHPLPEGFYKAVCDREIMAHTCMGNRVAMPHPCRVMTDDTFVSVAILKKPIQWDEMHEVQAIFLVSVSKQKNKQLQDFYSVTARLLLDEDKVGRLIQERTYQALAECLESVDKERMD